MFAVVKGLKSMQLYVGSRKGDLPASQVKERQQLTYPSPESHNGRTTCKRQHAMWLPQQDA